MNKQPFILLSKKLFALIISLMMLLNVFSVVLVNNVENIELSNKYAADTITKYCSIAVLIPIKVVNSFFKINTSFDIGTSVPPQTSNKNKKSKKDNTKEIFQSAVIEDGISSVQFTKNLTYTNLISFQNTYNNDAKDILFVVSLMLLFIVLFRGNMILARGDTEDIIIKKNINKLVRLV